MQKRGQAATEFLTTYGWAILILAIVVALIISLRIFNPRIENTCIGSDPISCDDMKFKASNLQFNLVLTASGISTAEPTIISEIKMNKPLVSQCVPSSPNLVNNAQVNIVCTLWTPAINLREGNKFSGTATIEYVLPGGDPLNPYISKIIFSGTVEE